MSKFSIITICYNEPNLERTCQSIVNQKFQDFEWIVIDGGSNAETLAIFEKYRRRIDVFVSEPDKGVYDALNKGIVRANGGFINFMNAGDKFADDDVLTDVAGIVSDKDEIIYGYTRITSGDEIVGTSRVDLKKVKQKPEAMLYNGLPHQAMFFRRNLFEKYGFYELNLPIYSDWDLNITFWKNMVNFRFVDRCIAWFDNSGISSNYWSDRGIKDRYIIVQNIFRTYLINGISNMQICFTRC